VLTKAGVIVQMRLLDELSRKGVELLTGVEYESFGRDGLTIRTEAGELRHLVADTYVLAAGARSDSDLVPALKERFDNVYVIGDAVEPRQIKDAIAEGFKIGCLI
jgi:NADH dehydrogenase FAD-containing subunit